MKVDPHVIRVMPARARQMRPSSVHRGGGRHPRARVAKLRDVVLRAGASVVLAALSLGVASCTVPPKPAVVPDERASPTETRSPAVDATRLTVMVRGAAGEAMAGVTVGARGGYDAKPRHVSQTDAQGRVVLPLESPGVVFVTVGADAKALVTYRSPASEHTVVVYVPASIELALTHSDSGTRARKASDGGLELWPVAESNARYQRYLEQVMATVDQPDELERRVDAHWSEIGSLPDEKLRKLLSIQYATYVAQAVGPETFADLFERVDPSDRAWVVSSAFVLELLWVLGTDERRRALLDGLEEHDDPGLRSAVTSWKLLQASKADDDAAVLELYRRLEAPEFAPTVGWRNARRYDPDRPISVARVLPAFTVKRTDPSHAAVTEASLSGKVWLVQAWATWCEPCREELDGLTGLYEAFADSRERLGFLSISLDADRSLAEATLQSHDVRWTSAWAPDAEQLRHDWGFSGVPLTLLVDERGRITQIWEGAVSMRTLEAAIRALLDPSPTPGSPRVE